MSIHRHFIFAFLACFVSGKAIAEVIDSAAGGFTVATEVSVDADAARAWQAAINNVDQWWSSDHTISGDAGRLAITAVPQGCFCENLDNDAGVVHMTVTMVSPQRVLRLTGGLGPLGLMGLNGNMTWEFAPKDAATVIKFTYAVGGYYPDGLDALAAPVDAVIGDALLRLKSYVETGSPDRD